MAHDVAYIQDMCIVFPQLDEIVQESFMAGV